MTGLKGWWPLTESSGVARDLSGGGNDGTVTGATQAASYAPGGVRAYSFDGTDDYVDTGATHTDLGIDSGGVWSVAFWVKYSVDGSRQAMIGTTNNASGAGGSAQWVMGQDIRSGTDGRLEINLRDESGNTLREYSAADVANDGAWHHIVWTYDGGAGINLYLDGASESLTQALNQGYGAMDNDVNPIYIGCQNDRGSDDEHLTGDMVDVRIYDRVLTANEAQTLYEWGAGDYAQPPTDGVSWWSFDDDATDQWGSNDGTVSGATFVSDGGPRGEGAYSFDGVDDYVDIPDVFANDGEAQTLCAWAKADAIPTSGNYTVIIGKNGTFASALILGNNLEVGDGWMAAAAQTDTTEYRSDSPATADEWTHLAGTFDPTAGEVTLYVNGVLADVTTGWDGTYKDADLSGRDSIGARKSDGTNAFQGDITDVRIYDRVLTAAEIHEVYRYGTLGRDMRKLAVEAR